MKKLLIGATLCASSFSFAVMIDDFTSGSDNATIFTGSLVEFQGGSMVGGERDVEMRIFNNPQQQPMDYFIGNGLEITSNGFGIDSRFTLQYDGRGDETYGGTSLNAGPGISPALDLSGQNRFRVNFVGNDLAVKVNAIVIGGGTSTASINVPSNGGSQDIMFSSFSGGANFGALTSITFQFEPVTSGDFALSSIEAVPEPASMVALALGASALIARRRRASK